MYYVANPYIILGAVGTEGRRSQKGAACCLWSSISLILIFGCFLWLMTTLLFVIGGLSDKLICQTLEDPRKSEIYNATNLAFDRILHDVLDIKEIENIKFQYDEIINSCKDDISINEVFNLSLIGNTTDLTNWKDDYNSADIIDSAQRKLDQELKKLANKLVIDQTTQNRLKENGTKFDELTGQFFGNISSISIQAILQKTDFEHLKDTIKDIGNRYSIEQATINNLTQDVGSIEDKLRHLDATIENVEAYRNKLLYNGPCDIECTIKSILDLTDDAQEYFKHISWNRPRAWDDINKTMVTSIESTITLGNIIGEYYKIRIEMLLNIIIYNYFL